MHQYVRSAYRLTVAVAVMPLPSLAQSLATGSQVPCAVPMTWTVARIDPGFDLSPEEALLAAREAGTLWETAVGAELFQFDAEAGDPILFDFDQRQAEVEEGRERDRALESERAGIEARRLEMDATSREYESMVRRYEQDVTEHDWAVRAYNNEMARLSREREVPRSQQAEMARRANDLDRSMRDLQNRVRLLNQLSDQIRDDVARFNEWVDAFSRRQTSHVQAYPQAPTEAGHYAETAFWQDGTVKSVERRIRVFQFSDHDELVRILTHEFGHALGLGHAAGERTAMSATDGGPIPGGITAIDTGMLAARCPNLGS